MSISDLNAVQISKMVDHILHIPGNYRGGNLEMTIVISSRLELISLKENVAAVVTALKRKNEIFRNVRLNLVGWDGKTSFSNEVVPLIFLQTGSCLKKIVQMAQEEKNVCQDKEIELAPLFAYLKKFHARSKVILVFAPEGYGETYGIGNVMQAKEALNPFLKQKLLLLSGEEPIMGTRIFMDSLQSLNEKVTARTY